MRLERLLFRVRQQWPSVFPGSPYDAAAPIAFMHIPKTSGVSLASGLREAVVPLHAIGGFDRVLFGGFRGFDSMAPHERNTIYLDASEVPADGDFVAAHMAFSTLRRRYRSANHVTVLREPMSRILSHWLFWRALSDRQLAPYGEWAEYLRQARKTLQHFLSCRDVACQVDNLSVRMLLWPHRLIPDDDFIDPCNDDALVNEAVIRLGQFGFSDVIENPDMRMNLQNWLGQSVQYAPTNETVGVPPLLKGGLHSELTPVAIDLLETRARLDRRLWALLAGARIGGASVEALQRGAILRSAARHSWLMIA